MCLATSSCAAKQWHARCAARARAQPHAAPPTPLRSRTPRARPRQCCPCVYYGQNMKRALLLDGYLHALIFIVGMDLFWLVGSIMRAKCADPTLPPPSPMRPVHRVPGTPAPPPSPPPLAAIARYNSCLDKANNTTGWVFFVTVAFFVYAVYRRHQMRKKFGMPCACACKPWPLDFVR